MWIMHQRGAGALGAALVKDDARIEPRRCAEPGELIRLGAEET
jgi:hypothetical protein